MSLYDKLDWHFDGAVEAGQPPENAFTHIGLYLEWLIRHGLHSPEVFSPEHVEAVLSGELTGSDLADDIETKLISADMNSEGMAFSDARYSAYLSEYGTLFEDWPDYGVAHDSAAYAAVERLLDTLHAEWVSAGRPPPPPAPEDRLDFDPPTAGMVMVPPGMAPEEMDAMLRDLPPGTTIMSQPTFDQMPHVAPDLEALIPTDLTSPPMKVSSVPANKWGSSLLKRALKRLDVLPRDAAVVTAMGGGGEETLVVSIYGVPGVPADRLDLEFRMVIFLPPGSKWQPREIAGRTVNWAPAADFTVGYWARDGVVIHVAGPARAVEAAVSRLP